MTQELYSVETVAERLGLHVKTVRAYVRDGKLRATRIGKQYRIARADFETLTGEAMTPALRDNVRRMRQVEVSSVVVIDAASRALHDRLTTSIGASVNQRAHAVPVRIDTSYDEDRAQMKIIISADADIAAALLGMISLITKDTV